MNGYCGDCDKQIEFRDTTVEHLFVGDSKIEVYLVCPWCDEKELMKVINT